VTALGLLLAQALAAAPPSTRPVEGLRENSPSAVAFVGGTVVQSAQEEPADLVVVIRDGLIERVGPEAVVPSDARVVDASGKTLYPGFIDAYGEVSVERSRLDSGTAHWNELVTPQLAAAESYSPESRVDEALRSQGVVARLAAPEEGILKGQSALVLTAADTTDRAVIADAAALHVRLTVPFRRSRDQYPNSPMGAIALARQAMLDADWYARAWQAYGASPEVSRPETNAALAALAPYAAGEKLVVFDAQNEQFALRADRFAREFGLRAAIRGSGNEYRRLDAHRDAGRTFIVPVDFPKPPNVATAENARHITLEQLMHWHLAPENPARLEKAGVRFAFTSHDLDDRKDFLDAVRKAVKRGLSKETALAALTTVPAELFGAGDRLGSIAPGKAAHLVVTDGDLFEDKTKVLSVWIDGKEHAVERPPLFDVTGKWELTPEQPVGEAQTLKLELSGPPERIKGKLLIVIESDATQQNDEEKEQQPEGMPPEPTGSADNGDGDDGIALKNLTLSDGRLTASFDAESLGLEGRGLLSLVVSTSNSNEIRLIGYVILPSGERINATAEKTSEESEEDGEEDDDAEDDEDDPSQGEEEDDDDDDHKDAEAQAVKMEVPVNFPLGAYGRTDQPDQPEWVLFKNATVWTCGPEGVLQNASVLVHDGRIEAVGAEGELDVPDDALVIDCQGKHLTPGIIDCHSHMATDGGINESSQAITAEVRIGDFIDADDMNIYRQLAGGVTSSNILHGSANPIGGQNQVIKLRWGALPEAMKMAEAPAGIKFALGENVKQSNWGERYTTRYPQTRMGVEQIIRDAFHAAQDYDRRWNEWRTQHRGLPPRRDLELEALAEIVRGERWIHCHSYRQDEILALLRTLEDFGIKIGSLQHILEGYKVAPEMVAHGAMGSSFSDWWAYKFEVFDAIPHNGALMHEAGVVVSFNSDDRELARHLNHEAAKAVKYGGVAEEEALKFVTLNPAKQLRIDEYVGSLEPGKHADVVVWSGPPLSLFSRCEETWIDGRKYFDRNEDAKERKRVAQLRAKLIQAVLRSGEKMAEPGEEDVDEADLWPREDLFCIGHDHGDH
jgi:N-acetylglucosamine-6-phosphate deacetylase